jgi:glycosyltransferase involved in cell wall biosynthesis
MNLYLTQDRIGTPTGGGAVTFHEYRALCGLGPETHPIDGVRMAAGKTPFEADQAFAEMLGPVKDVTLAAIYAGCFTKTVGVLRTNGAKVSYTAAAHDIQESRREFEELEVPFSFPHLTDPELWKQYVGGYLEADLVVCPSSVSKRCMESYGAKNVVVVPHGCEPPALDLIKRHPKEFTVGYLGQAGPDKGLRYLFAAWKRLGYKDATLLVAGNNVDQALPLWRKFGGGNVRFMGFVPSIMDFFNRISVYVQPSVTEGFGIEVLEAMAHARPVIVSEGAGAIDCVNGNDGVGQRVRPRDPDGIAASIDVYRSKPSLALDHGACAWKAAAKYTWSLVRETYLKAWIELIRKGSA